MFLTLKVLLRNWMIFYEIDSYSQGESLISLLLEGAVQRWFILNSVQDNTDLLGFKNLSGLFIIIKTLKCISRD